MKLIFDQICSKYVNKKKIWKKERFAFYGKNLQKEMRISTPGWLPRFDFPWLGANEKEQKCFLPKFASIQTNSPTTKTRHLIRRRDILETLTNSGNTFCKEAPIKDTTNCVSPINWRCKNWKWFVIWCQMHSTCEGQ